MDTIFSFDDTSDFLTNAHAQDDPGDQALIDLVPIPSESQTTDTETYDPFAGIFG